jgi:hypothetical protein
LSQPFPHTRPHPHARTRTHTSECAHTLERVHTDRPQAPTVSGSHRCEDFVVAVSAATAESKATRPVDEEDGRDGSSSSSKSDEAMARYSLQSSDLPLRRSVMIQDDGDESIRISITQ